MNPVYSTVIGACLTSFRLAGWDVRVTGEEHIPTSGGGVVATNHVGYLDFVFSGYGVRQQDKRRLRFVAKREVFDNPISGPLMRAMGHIPVDRGGDTMVAMREVSNALEGGDLVGMFPEGTISRSFVPLDGRPGAVRMAMGADVPLIPGAVWGTQRIYTKGRKPQVSRGAAITVAFGPRIEYSADDEPMEVHARLMKAIRGLVDDLQRTYPQIPKSREEAWWQPAHLGGTAPTPDEAVRLAEEEAAARRAKYAAQRQEQDGEGREG